MSHDHEVAAKNLSVRFVEGVLFNIKWLLPLFYIGLVPILLMYGLSYGMSIIEIFIHAWHAWMLPSTDEMKITALDAVDVVMIANLIKMIMTGSYNSFISKAHGRLNENISSGMLKIKISTSVIVVMMIHLLRSFVEQEYNFDLLTKQLAIFAAVLIGALVLGFLEFLHVKSEKIEHEMHH